MELKDYVIECAGRSDVVEIIPLGDVHIGARNCAERPFRNIVRYIKDHPNTYWIGGGDYLEAIKPQDAKRYDASVLPDWLLDGDASSTRKRLGDIVSEQMTRFIDIVMPIKDKCIGLIEGNHEFSLRKNFNDDKHKTICDSLGVTDLTDQALIRLKFKRSSASRSIMLYIRHGHLGGRAYGSEAANLARMLYDWDAEICLRGHSHSYFILPPVPVMYIPPSGDLPPELLQRMRYAANWGCWKYSNMRGLSTYESRAEYNAKPMMVLKVRIKPFARTHVKSIDVEKPDIDIIGEPV